MIVKVVRAVRQVDDEDVRGVQGDTEGNDRVSEECEERVEECVGFRWAEGGERAGQEE